MSDTVLVALISGGALVLAALVSVATAQLVRWNRRLRHLERRDRINWLYIRSLIDHAYRKGAIPLPEPPPGWLDDDEDE